MKYKEPLYIRDRETIFAVQDGGLWINGKLNIGAAEKCKSVSAAKKRSAELQGAEMGSGKVRTMESIRREYR